MQGLQDHNYLDLIEEWLDDEAPKYKATEQNAIRSKNSCKSKAYGCAKPLRLRTKEHSW